MAGAVGRHYLGDVVQESPLVKTRPQLVGGSVRSFGGIPLHCPEVPAIFVLTWYSLGIALAAGVGALLEPRLMRW